MLFDNSMLNIYKIVSKYRRFTNLDPIEGDWNAYYSLSFQYVFFRLQTLTRLKGIETLRLLWRRRFNNHRLQTLTRLKGIETPNCSSIFFIDLGLQTLTRLKGIET